MASTTQSDMSDAIARTYEKRGFKRKVVQWLVDIGALPPNMFDVFQPHALDEFSQFATTTRTHAILGPTMAFCASTMVPEIPSSGMSYPLIDHSYVELEDDTEYCTHCFGLLVLDSKGNCNGCGAPQLEVDRDK